MVLGLRGRDGVDGSQGPKGDTGATGAQGPAGPAGAQGPQGPPARAMLRLSGPFEGTNANVETTLDGVKIGLYGDGGASGGSVRYHGVQGMKLSDITQLSYTAEFTTSDDSPVGAPYLRIFLNGGNDDVVFDPTACATASPARNTLTTWNVVGSSDIRYDDVPATAVTRRGTRYSEPTAPTRWTTSSSRRLRRRQEHLTLPARPP